MTTTVASFDIGRLNFAFCIEKFDETVLQGMHCIPKSRRYTKEGDSTCEFNELMGNVCSEGDLVLHRNVNISDCDGVFTDKLLINMYNVLEENSSYFDKCNIILIEQQMSFGSNKTNTVALKLAQHCHSYFIFKYQDQKEIISFPAYHKTKLFDKRKMTKPERKKWATTKLFEILLERGDVQSLDFIQSEKKKDDLSDVVLQIQAFKFLRYIGKEL